MYNKANMVGVKVKKKIFCFLLIIAFVLIIFGFGLFVGSEIYKGGPVGIYSISSDGYKPAWNAIVAYMFILISIPSSIVSIIFSFVRINILNDISRIINFIIGIFIFIAGLLIAFVPKVFLSFNNYMLKNPSEGFIASAIILMISGIIFLIPALFDNKRY